MYIFVDIKPLLTYKSHVFLLLVLSYLLGSCTKKEPLEVDNESQCVVDHAIADQELTALIPAVFKHLSVTPGAAAPKGFGGNCIGFTLVAGDTTDFDPQVEYVIEASQLACSLADGKARAGKIHVVLNGAFGAEGKTATISLENYHAANYDYFVEGLKLTAKGSNNSYYSFLMELPSCRIAIDDQSFSYGCSRTLSVYGSAGYTTLYGTATGVSRTGESYTSDITKDLHRANSCAYFDSGELVLTPKNFKSRIVNFGDGTCDDQAVFAVNQNTVAFKLK